MNSIFEKTKINPGRQFELDIARGLAVIFMIAVHVLQTFSNEYVQSSIYGSITEFLGGPPAAPVFMFLLGAGIIYSTQSEPIILFKRGLIIFLSGYLLNILRDTIPSLVAFSITNDNNHLENSITTLVYVDILQFAGLTLVYFAIIKKLNFNLIIMTITGIVFIVINLMLTNIKTESLLLSTFSGLIWGSSKLSYFPFLSWIVYPIAGYCFGTFLIRCSNKSKFYLIMLISSAFLFLSSSFANVILFNIDLGLVDEYSYYHHNIFGNLIFLSFTISWISFLFFISKGFVGVMKTTVERWSKNVTSIYFIHWVLIGFLGLLLGLNLNNLWETIVITFLLTLLSDFLSIVYAKIMKNMEKV